MHGNIVTVTTPPPNPLSVPLEWLALKESGMVWW